MPDLRTLKGKRIIVRVDWNVPVNNGQIIDASRIEVSVPFLQHLSSAGAKIIILSHFGEKGESLEHVARYVTKNLPFITFNTSFNFIELEKASHDLVGGNGMLLENVRLFKGETENLAELADSFATLGEIFINDAFSVAHRTHASVVALAERKLSYFGPTFERELENLTRALSPVPPALLIIGGAKIATKLELINKYLSQGVKVFVGGAMVHNIWYEKGISIGQSFFDPQYRLKQDFINNPLLVTPIDVILENGVVVPFDAVPKDGVIVDCGPETVEIVTKLIQVSNTVIANGPVGLYEKGWLAGSEKILTNLAESKTTSYIGGGDTVTVAHKLGLLQKFNFVSLGGGAMLDFLSSGTLPGIDAVTK